MELISKKVPRSVDGPLKRIQARFQLKHRKRISEAKIIGAAVEHLEEHAEELDKLEPRKKQYEITDLIGLIKGGPRTNATEELDDVVYGDVDKT